MSKKDVSKMTLEELRQEYNRISDSKDYFGKVDICTRIIALDSNNAKAFYNRGFTYDELGEHKKAITDYTQAIKLNPKHAKAFYNRGFTYDELGEHKKAITDYTQAIKLNPKYADAFYNRGNAYNKLGEYQKAITDYTQAIKLNPKNAEFFYNRGHTYGELGEHKKAIEDYTQAIKLNPKDAKFFYNRGIDYGELDEYQKTITDYTQAIKLKPDYAKAFYNRGVVYRELGGKENEEKAIEDFKKAQKIDPSISITKQLEQTKELGKETKKVQEFQEILEELKSEHRTAEKIWLVVSVVAIIAMVCFLIFGQDVIGKIPNTVYVFDITNMPFNTGLYMAYVFFSIITFTIIRQYTNAKALRIEASNRTAMVKMFERVKNENNEYQKEFLPKLADAIVYSTLKEKNNTGNLVDKIIDGLERFKK